jgi:uncharacterized protein (UPF0332 family)
MFYAVLAHFLKSGINPNTSKHDGVISVFDKDFVHTGNLMSATQKSSTRFEARQTIV